MRKSKSRFGNIFQSGFCFLCEWTLAKSKKASEFSFLVREPQPFCGLLTLREG
jgi:hypothetical protein